MNQINLEEHRLPETTLNLKVIFLGLSALGIVIMFLLYVAQHIVSSNYEKGSLAYKELLIEEKNRTIEKEKIFLEREKEFRVAEKDFGSRELEFHKKELTLNFNSELNRKEQEKLVLERKHLNSRVEDLERQIKNFSVREENFEKDYEKKLEVNKKQYISLVKIYQDKVSRMDEIIESNRKEDKAYIAKLTKKLDKLTKNKSKSPSDSVKRANSAHKIKPGDYIQLSYGIRGTKLSGKVQSIKYPYLMLDYKRLYIPDIDLNTRQRLLGI